MSSVDERWEKLYRKVEGERIQREEVDGKQHVGELAKADFDAWCRSVAKGVMDNLCELAIERAERFRLETGAPVSVVYPSQAPNVQIAQIAAEMIFLKLALDRVRVHLYSARSSTKLPAFHFVSMVEPLRPTAGAPERTKRTSNHALDRVVSTPIGRAVQIDERKFVLQERGASTSGGPAALDPDLVVFKAFNMLVTLWRRSQKPA